VAQFPLAIAQALGTTLALTGREALYRQRGAVVYDPATGDASAAPATDVPVRLLLRGYRAEELQPDVVLASDRHGRVPMAALSQPPHVADAVVLDGVVWEVLAVEADVAQTSWEFQLRQRGEAQH
jgi:hypothetical protein